MTVKKFATILILSIFFFKSLNARKQNFMKKCEKKTFNRRGMLKRIILIKLALYLTDKCQKKETIHRLISWQNPVKIKILQQCTDGMATV